ncbi:MAG: phosphoadenylyl-sulfate reductase [Chloroflexi bacterium]|nr:phosphoadenylyl-sulfate reductase [Chloroflexota bacterium]MBT7081166.1 phosphoadenylyl-sulfate reductase [Chloroflexota bacterium]MBT7290731.1 phosphoadenylyl-sulfate reductase [Chloroflexota bacterium]
MDKVKHAKEVIEYAIKTYPKIGVACSFGKDSMVAVHLAREVDPNIEVFAVMTMFKPQETYDYLKKMNKKMNLNTTIYMVGNSAPEAFNDASLNVELLPAKEFETISTKVDSEKGAPIYKVDPDECCRLLKVDPTKEAVKNLDAWVTGLRNTEGRTRTDYEEIENKGGLMKINPILTFTEAEIWSYMSTRGIEPHPWYSQGYRSLGCAPCSSPGGDLERDGRWQDTSKCGGECGIHTQVLK